MFKLKLLNVFFYLLRVHKHRAKKCFKQHTRHLRKSLRPGTICIVLAGPHKGKRVVLLKQLESGLLLVTGPFLVNACPMRRINQNYVIGTKTQIDLKEMRLPKTVNDVYFRRERKKRAKKEEGDIFSTKKESYKPTDQRKADQKTVDNQVRPFSLLKKCRKLFFWCISGDCCNQEPPRPQNALHLFICDVRFKILTISS